MTDRDESTPHLASGSAANDANARLPAEYWLPPAGTIIAGKYRIEGPLGRGGMGVVALGKQLELDRPVAIKFLRAALAVNARPLQRFAREARIVAQMRSEHVVRVFDVGRERQVPFIVMELLRGHDLAKELERGPLVVERAVAFALHACEALGEAHSLGIVHRDVKPSNLFVAEGFGGKELLKVLDFGVSKWLAPPLGSETTSLSGDDGAVGTPAFASPEQLTHPERIDGRTDVWALGVVLYRALSGALPFEADTIPALYSRIIGGEPAPFRARHDVPTELVAVIERCLRREPEERYASMLELARALAPFAPSPARGTMDSLATLPSPESAAGPSERPELTSPFTTTLEFAEKTPPEAEPRESARKASSKHAVALMAFASLLIGGLALWWPRAAPPKRVPAMTDVAAIRPTATAPTATVESRWNDSAAGEPLPDAGVQNAPPLAANAPKRKATPTATENSTRTSAAKPKSVAVASRANASAATPSAASVSPPASAVPVQSAAPPPSATAAHGDGIPLYRR